MLLVPIAADASFMFTAEGRIAVPRNAIRYRADNGETFEQVAALNTGWISQADQPFVARKGPVRLWAKFELPASAPRQTLIQTGPWEHVEYFIVRDGKLVGRQSVGLLVPWSERTERITTTPLFLYAGLAPAETAAGAQTTVFAHLSSGQRFHSARAVAFVLRDREATLEAERRDRIFEGLFYGVVLVIVLYNLGVFVAIREPSFLYFVLFQACGAFIWATFSGFTDEFLWPSQPTWDPYVLWLALSLGSAAAAQFVRYYLDTRKYFPRIDRVARWLAVAYLLMAPLIFVLPGPVVGNFDFWTYWTPLGSSLAIAVMIYVFVQRHPQGLILLIAMACIGGGLLLYSGASLEVLPSANWTLDAPKVGAALAGIILSIGLGFRVRAMREEFTRGLEAKVVERTAELIETQRQLETANRHKSDFLAHMSHELRTPLNSIIGFSEVLRERMFGEVNEKQADYLKDIHDSGRHLLSLINDILDLSKIEAGKMELQLSSFDLPTAIGNAVTLVRERAMRHGVTLDTRVDPKVGSIDADERKVKQILLNLLSNAVKFTPEGGRVDVSARLGADSVEIAVRDTGAGISAADQESLFKEFQQVGSDTARKSEGTGLGLALTRKFVELHGGQIRVDSEVGKGSTFAFTLPLAKA